MPELPDVTVYRERLEALLAGEVLEAVRLRSAFVVRPVDPPLDALVGATLRSVERLGKRLVFGFDGELLLVLHLMIAGRLQWYPREKKLGGRIDLAAFDFAPGTLVLTEAGTKKRASLHLAAATRSRRSTAAGARSRARRRRRSRRCCGARTAR